MLSGISTGLWFGSLVAGFSAGGAFFSYSFFSRFMLDYRSKALAVFWP
jgi:hypothetical protein